jgi:hypothetical protein
MTDITNWDLYRNVENGESFRANLVYSAYRSPDKKHFCQWFVRDPNYHIDLYENSLWTDELLEDRFQRELKYHERASKVMPTLDIVDVDLRTRQIVYAWPGDDFLMQSYHQGTREKVLPDWQEQWVSLIEKMWSVNITKLSLHPNSWTVRDGVLVPFNWFYCYDTDTDTDSFENMSIQISHGRKQDVYPILERFKIEWEKQYPVKQLQLIAFNSFRKNYPSELIDRILAKL